MLRFSEISLKRYKTAVLYLSFLSLGLSAAIPGPTLLDLQNLVQTDTSHIAYIYLARSSGYLLGSFVGGIILDCLQKKQLLLFIFNLVISIGDFATPCSRNVYTLVTVMAVSGAAMGALDTGGNVWCLDLWGEDSSPYFQALHFLFGLGAFLAPLIAEPFLAQQEEIEQFSNVTSSIDNHTNSLLNFSFFSSLSPITYAYSIIGMFSFLVTVMFLFLFCMSSNEEHKGRKKVTARVQNPSVFVSVIVVILSSLLLSIYAGIEIGYGQMIATYAVKSNLHVSKSTASLITSVYWGTFTLSRGFSIILATKLSPLSLIFTDFFLMLLASVILVIFGNSYIDFLWIGTAVLGLGLASFYPSTITWIERHINVNNQVASAFVVAASLGEMIVPLTVSQFIEAKPEILLYIVVFSVIACGFFIFILLIITKKVGVKYIVEQPVPNQISEAEYSDTNIQDEDENNV